ncbi:MAG: dihydrofolate reductase [Bacteroidetes bacterium]|nr:MAG: dihydrofolate reductase [Bacteroidota bacterium]
MKISAIVAAAENNVIGKDNRLIWRLPADMKFFKEKTTGHCVVTGRKNYESIPDKFRPLPDRTNIVVTRQPNYNAPGATVVNSIEAAVAFAKAQGETELFIIGGGEIYRQFMPLYDNIYLTRVHATFEGDAFFPDLDTAAWQLKWTEAHAADEKHLAAFTFQEWNRR